MLQLSNSSHSLLNDDFIKEHHRLPVFVSFTSPIAEPNSLLFSLRQNLSLLRSHVHRINIFLLYLEKQRIEPVTKPLNITELSQNRVKATRCALVLRRADGMIDWVSGWLKYLEQEVKREEERVFRTTSSNSSSASQSDDEDHCSDQLWREWKQEVDKIGRAVHVFVQENPVNF